jgi:hypothetical protein
MNTDRNKIASFRVIVFVLLLLSREKERERKEILLIMRAIQANTEKKWNYEYKLMNKYSFNQWAIKVQHKHISGISANEGRNISFCAHKDSKEILKRIIFFHLVWQIS